MSEYRLTVGLEIHAELTTHTKMFCGCLNNPDEETPNQNVCPVCLAHPGTLPVINKEAVRKVLLVGKALGAQLADFTEFDRKNYFYPDIPKGYQISQYKYPLVRGGSLAGVAITRVHLEEDTARSQHQGEQSLVDYNRAGVPLMELVTEPVIHSAKEAGDFARELQLLLRYLGAGHANMEKGEMRVEANISISPSSAPEGTLGTKVEVKNLNSFRSVERAIAYECERQAALLVGGGEVVQETRGWDEAGQKTFSQRKKESSHDYRYFPDPDLPALKLSELPDFAPEALEAALPELPEARRARYGALGLKAEDAAMFVEQPLLGTFFDAVAAEGTREEVLLTANYLASDIAGKYQGGEVSEAWLADTRNALRLRALMALVLEGALSSRGAKEVLTLMLVGEGEPAALAEAHGLVQQSDESFLLEVARKVVEAHPGVAADYKAGKTSALQFLVGQGMKESKGSANPASLRKAVEQMLG